MKYDDEGRELPDPTPVQLTVKQRMSVDRFLADKRQILAAIERDKEFEGQETFEESMDFEVEDDDMPITAAEQAEIDVDDMRRTAAYVREKEYLEDGKRRFAKDVPPAKPGEARDRSGGSDNGKEVGGGKNG